jgi:hypothetical protein
MLLLFGCIDSEEVADESVSESVDVQIPDATHEVDEDGYRLRPKNDWTSGGEQEERSAFYSSSDSDSGKLFAILLFLLERRFFKLKCDSKINQIFVMPFILFFTFYH